MLLPLAALPLVDLLVDLSAIRRPVGGGRLLFGLSRHPWVALVVLVALVALAIWLSRRRR